jgi:general secretion pathway protein A
MLAALFAGEIYLAWDNLSDRVNALPDIKAAKEQIEKAPLITGEKLFRAMTAELGKVPESESGRRAFNNLAGFWNVPPVPENSNLNTFNEMERAAHDRELRLYRFSGNLGALLRIDYPAVLELTIPGISGKRFVSLVGMENEQLFIDPPIGGRKSLSFRELEKHWSGQGFLLWKDPLNLLNFWANIWPGAKGVRIQRLQDLLREAGAYKSPSTGVYDDDTLSAVKEFQSSRGIIQDGIVGSQTLILLYRSIDRFELPRLTMVQK